MLPVAFVLLSLLAAGQPSLASPLPGPAQGIPLALSRRGMRQSPAGNTTKIPLFDDEFVVRSSALSCVYLAHKSRHESCTTYCPSTRRPPTPFKVSISRPNAASTRRLMSARTLPRAPRTSIPMPSEVPTRMLRRRPFSLGRSLLSTSSQAPLLQDTFL